ncbi:hypothetical protein [Leptospira kirschneri]|uniref:hypothetical protein n=1 Tax=Leptospira kirschneri TaxID=29507 RepID=UPI003B96833A
MTLHDAVWQYERKSVEILLAAGADVNAADESDWTPIWLASKFEPFMALIQHGATVNSRMK